MLCKNASAGIVITTALAVAAQVETWVRKDTTSGIRLVQFTSPPQNALPRRSGAIQLVNDPESGGIVKFLVNGQEQSLQPGEAIDLPNDRAQIVDFDSGGTAGDLQYSLYGGLYKFKVTDRGWGLFKSSGTATTSGTKSSAASVPDPPLPSPDLAHRKKGVRADAVPAPPSPGVTKPIPQPPQPAAPIESPPAKTTDENDQPPPPPLPML